MNWHENRKSSKAREALWGLDWPGHPEGNPQCAVGISLRDEPERWALLAVFTDPQADYSYDDLAIMRRDDGLIALLRTSGCSCPSPTETWGVHASGSLLDLVAAVARDREEWSDGAAHGPFIGAEAWLSGASL